MTVIFWILLAIVVCLVLGWSIVDFTAAVLGYAVVGLVIGGLSRLLVRGTDGYGFGLTIVAGVFGALIGGMIAHALDVDDWLKFAIAVIVSAVLVGVSVPATRR